MDFESIKHLGVNPYLFIFDDCEERFDQDNINHIIILHMIKENNKECPLCKSNKVVSKGTKSNEFIHANRDEKNIKIKLYRHVYKCNNCNHYFRQDNPFVIQGNKLTHSNDVEILEAIRNIKTTYSDIAKRFNVSPTYVQNLFDKKVKVSRGSMPTVLAIDEVYNRKLTSTKYCCVLYDPMNRKIVDILDSRRKDYLIDYFARIPYSEKKEIVVVSMDLYKNYRDIVHLCLPEACIAADSFHVIKNLNECFNKIRKRIMRNYEFLKKEKSYYYWFLKKFWKYLLMNVEDPGEVIEIRKTGATMTVTAIIEAMLKVDEELKRAYNLKELYREFNLTATYANANEQFDVIAEAFKQSQIKEYYTFYKLLINWKNEILTSFLRLGNWRVSNGNLERKNSDIKTLVKVSNGFTNFTRTRNRIMFSINKNVPIKSDRLKDTNKYKGQKRKPYKKNK